MDGRGYHRLQEREVPLTSRIVMVADAFDAMTTDRVYRNALRLEDAVAELDRHAGRQFDADVVAAFHRLLDRGAMPLEEALPAAGEPLSRPGLVGAGLI
jgi:HD-GYP domain-containing protein (c-di-GMP phosphodiesterase class II)